MAREIIMVLKAFRAKEGGIFAERDDGLPCTVCYGANSQVADLCMWRRLDQFAKSNTPLVPGQRVICPGPQSSDGFRMTQAI